MPKISVLGRVILGQPFKIQCLSNIGSPPINYTLVKEYDQLNTIIVMQPSQPANFTAIITKTDEIKKFMCEAKNSHREGPLSNRLNAPVIGKHSK